MSYPNPFDEPELAGMQSCPVHPISTEQFDTGMDEVKRMYALVVTENEGLREQLKKLEPYVGHKPSCELPSQGIRGICDCGLTQTLATLSEYSK